MQYMISIDRIRTEETVKVEEAFSPEFLEINEEDLSFSSLVSVKLEFNLSGDFLLIDGLVKTEALCRCKICNELFPLPLSIKIVWSSEEPLTQEFDLFSFLREQILLEIPPFAECHGGTCPQREALQNYFTKQNSSSSPFSNL